MAFFSRARTVSEGWAPTASHFLMAGAFKLVSLRSGSYQPRFCTLQEHASSMILHVKQLNACHSTHDYEAYDCRLACFSAAMCHSAGHVHLNGLALPPLPRINGNDAVEWHLLPPKSCETDLCNIQQRADKSWTHGLKAACQHLSKHAQAHAAEREYLHVQQPN
jgi:hypothetical protein